MARYAIIKTGGKQYRVGEGDVIDIERVPEEVGQGVGFAEVLFISDADAHHVGQPNVAGWSVQGEVVDYTVGPKVTSVKYKQRKNQRRKFGHRQKYSRVKITAIQPI
jgi:large subunit ribosomal protein L21